MAKKSKEQTKRDKKRYIEAWGKSFGNITQTCKAIGITRQCYHNWLKNDPDFKKALEDVEPDERFLDFLEAKAAERINKGSDAVLIFALKTKGKKRGWIERRELEVSGDKDKPLTWKLVKGDNDK